MYRIPKDLDLSPAIGQSTAQIRVGQFDVQFSLGDVHFSITSQINLFRDGELIGHWEEGKWPDAAFFDTMNTEVMRCEAVSDRLIVIVFANGLEMHLSDDSDQYECMKIRFKDDPSPCII